MVSVPNSEASSLHEMLKGSLLFHDVDDVALQFIASQLETVSFKRGDPIILENEISDHVYFIRSGSIEIVKYHPELQQVGRVAVLKPGTHFSEFSVLSHSNKSASAFALEDSILYRMSGEAFVKVVHRLPLIGRRLVQTLAELIQNSAAHAGLDYFDPESIVCNSEILKIVPQNLWRKFGILPLRFGAGILLVAAKDPHKPEFFSFCKGATANLQVEVVLISDSDYEQAFKKLVKRYAEMGSTHPEIREPEEIPEIKECLSQCPYFSGVSGSGLDQLADLFEPLDLKPGEILFKPGDAATHFCIVASGRIEMSRPAQENRGWSGVRSRVKGDGMSEISLLLQRPHTHMARATMPTRVFRLNTEMFSQLLNSGIFCFNLSKILVCRLQSMSESGGVKYFSSDKPVQVKELFHLIPRQVMQQNHILPLRLVDNEITLGVVSPGNEAIYSIVTRYLRGYRVSLELITSENFKAWMIEATGRVVPKISAAVTEENRTVIELNKLILDGFDTRASDLHLEPTGTGYSVRYRVDGVLTEIASKIPNEVGQSIVNRIKVIGQMDISNHMTPQDGQLMINEDGQEYAARVATTPTRQGEGAVLRLVRSRNSAVPLSMLAPDARAIKQLRAISRVRQGLFLVTGPTGSGKTTTLYSLINELNRVDVKIISLEDPVELEIPGVTQIEINEKTGLTFERALKSTLRQDPDIMILGEIRDPESAKSVFEAALAGHLVISTLHTNNSFAVKNRLKELGVPLGTMAAGLIGSMAQRLVRKICKNCRVSRVTTNEEKSVLTEHLRIRLPDEMFSGKGCLMCGQTGFHGRLPIMEIWQKTREFEDLISADAGIEAMLEGARHDGFDTLFEFGLKMAVNGLTTVEEVSRCMAGGL